MSLILDALNRSGSDRDRDGVPSVDSVHYQPTQRRPIMLWGLIAVLILALLVTLVMLFRGAPESGVPSSSTASQPPESASARQRVDTAGEQSAPAQQSVAAALPPPQPEQSASTKVAANPAVQGLYKSADQPAQMPKTKAPEPVQDQAEAKPNETAAASEPPAPEEASLAEAEETPIDIEEVLRDAQRQLGEEPLLPHPAPLLENLSQQTKDRIPTVVYSAHDFAADGRSSVTLNGQRLSVGQRAKGFQVKEILEDSVILSWGGSDFRLRALNSWINL